MYVRTILNTHKLLPKWPQMYTFITAIVQKEVKNRNVTHTKGTRAIIKKAESAYQVMKLTKMIEPFNLLYIYWHKIGKTFI